MGHTTMPEYTGRPVTNVYVQLLHRMAISKPFGILTLGK